MRQRNIRCKMNIYTLDPLVHDENCIQLEKTIIGENGTVNSIILFLSLKALSAIGTLISSFTIILNADQV